MQGFTILALNIACILVLWPPRVLAARDVLPLRTEKTRYARDAMNVWMAKIQDTPTTDEGIMGELGSAQRRHLLQTYAYSSSTYTISFVGCYHDCTTRIFASHIEGYSPLQCVNYVRSLGYFSFGLEYPGKLHLAAVVRACLLYLMDTSETLQLTGKIPGLIRRLMIATTCERLCSWLYHFLTANDQDLSCLPPRALDCVLQRALLRMPRGAGLTKLPLWELTEPPYHRGYARESPGTSYLMDFRIAILEPRATMQSIKFPTSRGVELFFPTSVYTRSSLK
jgi:hypothetical protein